VVLCGAIVVYPLIAEHYHFIANIQFTFEILPYLWVGYLLRNYGEQIDQYLNTVVGFICLGIVVYASRTLFIMDMTLGVVYPYMHLLGLSGIYVMMVLAKYLKKVAGMRRLFSYMGAHSLSIMIIHFVLLRLMDKVMCLVDKDVTGEVYSTLPVSYPNRWWAYLLVVVPTSVGIVKMIDFIKRKCIK
jgi:fucose 4-O-acetylase-like acetyltransferase